MPAHELAHAGLNYLDEYAEQGLENTQHQAFDVLTPLALFDWSWGGFVDAITNFLGVYSYNISEVLANNGNDNVTTRAVPAPSTRRASGADYAYQGGMFFGLGTWHMPGANLMDDNNVMRGRDDGFAYAHSPSQQRVIDHAFGGGIRRPNDRLRNAGPMSGWPLAFGSTTHVMLFDGDKNHHFQPTQSYSCRSAGTSGSWHTCWGGPFPYPCYDDVWTTARKLGLAGVPVDQPADVVARTASSSWRSTWSAPRASTRSPRGGGTIRLCDQDLDTIADNFLPTVNFPVPYQDVSVPASQWITTYWWRFGTWNGRTTSGYTDGRASTEASRGLNGHPGVGEMGGSVSGDGGAPARLLRLWSKSVQRGKLNTLETV